MKNIKNEIEWFEEDGSLGGQHGLVFNLETNIVTKWNGVEEKLSKNNIDDVIWCIDNNIKYLAEQISKIELKLNQKETKYIKIDSGYKISEPLNKNQIIYYERKMNLLILELEWLNSISLQQNIA